MRIGIDIDDTICKTTETLEPELIKYDKEVLRGSGIIHPELKYFGKFDWTKEEKNEFKKKYIKDILKNSSYKKDALEIINKLYNEGFEIIYITARNSSIYGSKTTKDWLIKNGFPITKLIMDGDEKGSICAENKIDFFIDDSKKHCKEALEKCKNIKVIGFNIEKNDSFTVSNNWYEIYKIIKENIN